MHRDKVRGIEGTSSAASRRRSPWLSAVCAIGVASTLVVLGARGGTASLDLEQQTAAADVDLTTIKYPSGAATIEAYLAKPKGAGKYKAVLLVHDNHGLDEHTRNVARRFAGAGFVVAAPDLLSRIGGTGQKSPEEIMNALGQTLRDAGDEDFARQMGRVTPGQTLADVTAGFAALEKMTDVDAMKISAIGLGWGGWRTFRLAVATPSLYRAVVFYGATPDDGLAAIQAPILAHYARFDHVTTGNAIWTRQQLGKKFAFHVYPASRGFFDDKDRQYDAKSAELAWTRTQEFLR